MKVTEAMVQVFMETPAPPGWVGDAVIRVRLQAVLDLIERDRGVVMVTRKLFDQMKQDVVTLRQLERAGVDNWSNYDAAMAGIQNAEDEGRPFSG